MSSGPQARPSMPAGGHTLSRLARAWQTTNAPDYVGLLLLAMGWLAFETFVTPFHRMFFINDLTISFPHAVNERVSALMALVYAFVFPIGVFIGYGLAFRPSLAKQEATYLSFVVTAVLTGFLTDVVKNAVGRPRPDLLARCRPASGTEPNRLVTVDVCTAPDNRKLHDGWRSFPSGHSSQSFAGLGFLTLFLAGQLHLFRPTGGRDLCRALLCLLPLLGATLIAISRCEDYRHDVYDVSCGAVLGLTVAYWSYRRHWPKLSCPTCDTPLPRPGSETGAAHWHRIRDEEAAVVEPETGYEMDRLPMTG
ncbi:hypothetical protein L249_3060 [Ophiocordyceps polyrhachis-furcata BCC 54312]|uniref:Phosphatidic acid phosphatase type 2/haloperoxidase domain-containing protein n=1 Tax=Ophiocordyceps polyrhachis-furcata BCC 54312 TaxID=1330021 RepID=A0A367LNQ4_9HYPO|nr:hypothetical protein L249_3060 [Ophiocordyceps polyrhachis-furcata BCC 54312]